MQDYDYSFSQNGLVAYKAGELIGTKVELFDYLLLDHAPSQKDIIQLLCRKRSDEGRLIRL